MELKFADLSADQWAFMLQSAGWFAEGILEVNKAVCSMERPQDNFDELSDLAETNYSSYASVNLLQSIGGLVAKIRAVLAEGAAIIQEVERQALADNAQKIIVEDSHELLESLELYLTTFDHQQYLVKYKEDGVPVDAVVARAIFEMEPSEISRQLVCEDVFVMSGYSTDSLQVSGFSVPRPVRSKRVKSSPPPSKFGWRKAGRCGGPRVSLKVVADEKSPGAESSGKRVHWSSASDSGADEAESSVSGTNNAGIVTAEILMPLSELGARKKPRSL